MFAASARAARRLPGRSYGTAKPTVLYSWGFGTDGQLGHQKFPLKSGFFSQYYQQEDPRRVIRSAKFRDVAVGGSVSVAVTTEGALYACGKSDSLLSAFNGHSSLEFLELPFDLNVESVSVGINHAALVDTSGRVFAWGTNSRKMGGAGMLGIGTQESKTSPTQLKFFEEYGARVVKVSCGENHTLFLTDDGEVLASGRGEYGVLGLGHSDDCLLPVPLDTLADEDIVSISASQDHSLALSADGHVYSWGRNNNGQLGNVDSMGDQFSMEEIPTKIRFPCALDTYEERNVKIAYITTSIGRSAVVTEEGEVYLWGQGISHVPRLFSTEFFGNEPVKKVWLGGDSKYGLLAMTASGKIYTMGHSGSGLLPMAGLGKETTPLQVPFFDKHRAVDLYTGMCGHAFAKVEVDL